MISLPAEDFAALISRFGIKWSKERNRAVVTIRIDELVDERRIVICCGTGGVGKTTVAAVLALESARRGRNACVVTIATALRNSG